MGEVVEVDGVLKESISHVELQTSTEIPVPKWRLLIRFETAEYPSAESETPKPETLRPATREVERVFGAIKDDVIEAEGAPSLTITQLAALIKAAAYRYRAEDIAAAGA